MIVLDIVLQVSGEGSYNHPASHQDRNTLWWTSHLDHARTNQDGGTLQKQEQDQTQEEMVPGKLYL